MKDTQIYNLVRREEKRQREGVELIPSENYASAHVRRVLSSYFVNKYSEGYPKGRYYGGNEVVDDVEILAQERTKALFGVEYVNVQPYSGSPANFAVYMACCKPADSAGRPADSAGRPADVIMGQALTAGGHLTHGHFVSASGIFFRTVQYGVRSKKTDGKTSGVTGSPSEALAKLGTGSREVKEEKQDLFDYDEIRRLAKKHKPKLIWVGATAYPLKFKYKEFAKIADEVGAYLAADIAHVAGLIVGGVHPSPVPYVHIITTTTHKTLRGPRGAMIMITKKGLRKDPELPMKIDKAVFPGLQGGPHDNQTAAIAVALWEASRPSFKKYAHQIVKNSKVLARELKSGGLYLVGGGSENHLILADLSPTLGPGAGIFAEKALDMVGLTLNKNTVPDEPSSPFYPSGIRLGTPAATTRGMGAKEMQMIGRTIVEVLHLIGPYQLPKDKKARTKYISDFDKAMKADPKIKKLRQEIKTMTLKFPIP